MELMFDAADLIEIGNYSKVFHIIKSLVIQVF